MRGADLAQSKELIDGTVNDAVLRADGGLDGLEPVVSG